MTTHPPADHRSPSRTSFLLAIGAGITALLCLAVQAQAAVSLGLDPFALHAPNLCAQSAGAASRFSSDPTYVTTWSRTQADSAGSDGRCNDPVGRPSNTLAAQPKLLLEISGTRYLCRTGSHASNPSGAAWVEAGSLLKACTGGTTRFLSGHRATFAGVETRDDRASAAL